MAILEAQTKYGAVRGLWGSDASCTVFRGIPYAAPPVGERRWKAPREPEAWPGVRECYCFSSVCPQLIPAPGSFYGKEFPFPESCLDEDCLYLNIWTPASSAEEKLPVAFWIHGGAMTMGCGHKVPIDGEAFARNKVILVSVNYRLNIFGYLAHPELTAESPNHQSGNYAILDLTAAIRWVRQNIQAFGGDPENITIMGQSAGAMAVQSLCTTPLTKGLFNRAIFHSNGGRGYSAVSTAWNLKDAEAVGVQLFSLMGVKDLAGARNVPAAEWVELMRKEKTMIAKWMPFRPICDGYVHIENTTRAFFNGGHHDVSYMLGCTNGEGIIFEPTKPGSMDEFRQSAIDTYGDDADEFLRLAGITALEELDAFYKYERTEFKRGFAEACGVTLAREGKNCYLYYFDRVPPGGDVAAAHHSGELPYLFHTLEHIWRPYVGEDFEISNRMVKYWCNFIRSGNPNDESLGHWTPYREEAPYAMHFANGGGMKPFKQSELSAFFKNFGVNKLKTVK